MKIIKSILQTNDERCFLCGSYRFLEWHHIFGAANRKNSEKYGLKVRLCHYCHNEPPGGIHHNKQKRLLLQKIGQEAFEKEYPQLNFIEIFGRNYK